jgi:hypothetical protein
MIGGGRYLVTCARRNVGEECVSFVDLYVDVLNVSAK